MLYSYTHTHMATEGVEGLRNQLSPSSSDCERSTSTADVESLGLKQHTASAINKTRPSVVGYHNQMIYVM